MPLGTAYISTQMLNDASTGIAWNLIPDINADDAAKAAEQTNIIWRATSMVDTECNQILRATVDNEQLTGPRSQRCGFLPGTQIPQLVMRRSPITSILAVQITATDAFPESFSALPATDYRVQHPLINMYTDAASATAPDGAGTILLAKHWLRRTMRRNQKTLLVSYTNGWPHTSLTGPASQGDTQIQVDDVTGWTGAVGMVYDGSATEPTTANAVSADSPLQLPNGAGTAQTGPGTVTLTAPLSYDHETGVLVSSLPPIVQQATIYACVLQALESGIDAITAETLPGRETVAGHGLEWIEGEFEKKLNAFRRVV